MRSLHEAWDCLLERSCKQERARGHRVKTGLRLSSRSHSVVTIAVYKPLLDIVGGGTAEGAASLGAAPPAVIAQQRGRATRTRECLCIWQWNRGEQGCKRHQWP